MNYIVSIAKHNIIPQKNSQEYSSVVTKKTHHKLHDIECGEYIRGIINYHIFTSPILSSRDIVTNRMLSDTLNGYIVLTYSNIGSIATPYIISNTREVIRMFRNLLHFLTSNHITHANINTNTLRMNKYNTHPILIDFSNSIVNNKYVDPSYNPKQHWKSPLYHLFCYTTICNHDVITEDMVNDIISDISTGSLGMMMPIQYITHIKDQLYPYMNMQRIDVISRLLTLSHQWDIYSLHVLLYECVNDNEINTTCKQYIMDGLVSLFK